jgi:hypothetical protein
MAENINTYTGEQIVLSSGRLVFNSRSNDVFISSRRYINLSAGDKVTIDVGAVDSDKEQNMFLVNAPRMQLGLERYGRPEPITKADQLETVLTDLINALSTYSDMLPAFSGVRSLKIPATFLKGRLSVIKSNFINFKSTKSFTI